MTPAGVRPESVIGPLGQRMTLASLPPPDTKRWIAHRKAELVAAVDGGLLTIEEVCEQYNMAVESSSHGNAASSGLGCAAFG